MPAQVQAQSEAYQQANLLTRAKLLTRPLLIVHGTADDNVLFEHSTRPEFIYRHRWDVHDMMFWDNRCTMHYALADYDFSVRRHMHRTTVAGDVPY